VAGNELSEQDLEILLLAPRTKTKRAGFALEEIMMVVAIKALLAAIAVPGFLPARKRSQALKILNGLRLIPVQLNRSVS
jgi:type II secretory pathway pseudopilin PulG